MNNYRCRKCCYYFCSENGIPYCPACECEKLEYIDEEYAKEIGMESHHIHPKFMDNRSGKGQQFMINKNTHGELHGNIMNWLWQEIPEDKKDISIKNIITKSKKFIGK